MPLDVFGLPMKARLFEDGMRKARDFNRRSIMDTMETIILAVLGSTALSSLIQFLIKRWDDKHNVKDKLITLEKDVLRTQMLLLILIKPEEKQEILTIGEHYFGPKIKGNWYMTSIFNKWLESSGVAKPEWFEGEKK